GRAPPCQGGGSEFEPRHPLQRSKKKAFALRVLFLFAVKIRQISLLIFINILIVYSYVNYF
ncbi:hypothetical protein, partial [Pseudoruminococcus massiliensis]|uniref:hypothetical protein n=1 Tax=Pseudoruminococcus massiliensis TaxID=2086583 RepID=UPI003FD76444